MSAPGSGQDFKPYIAADAEVPEFTLKAILLGSAFGIIFGAATVYLALRAGLTVSASVPIAVLSIAVFKKLGKSTILENNIVQTIGSAGESVAAGVVFTVPALLFLSNGTDYFKYFVDLPPRRDRRDPRRPLHDPAPSGAHREGARKPEVPRGSRLRRRPHRGREGRQPREDGLRGRGRRDAVQVPLRHPRSLARDGHVVPDREGRQDSRRDALVRRDARIPRPRVHHRAEDRGRARLRRRPLVACLDSSHLDLRARNAPRRGHHEAGLLGRLEGLAYARAVDLLRLRALRRGGGRRLRRA